MRPSLLSPRRPDHIAGARRDADGASGGRTSSPGRAAVRGRLTGAPATQGRRLRAERFKAYGLRRRHGRLSAADAVHVQRTALIAPTRPWWSMDRSAPAVGPDILLGSRLPQPKAIEAPLVFIGYGLHLPEIGYDDFAGQDLKGKIAVYVNGGPSDISAALKSHSRGSETWRAAQAAGAVGLIALPTPKSMDVPWERQIANSSQPGMYPADLALREVKGERFSASFNPAQAEKLFARSGHSFAEVLALADAGQADQGLRPEARPEGPGRRRRHARSPRPMWSAKLPGTGSEA